ncbi:MAG: hypothetical protein VXY93_17310, partial [Pseudomonadota bacterium]|nr:hypothetical protein [Pseudomonadota bacterium]
GSNSTIEDTGTGNFYIKSDSVISIRGTTVAIKSADNSQTLIKGVQNAGSELYYNGNRKFITTNTGATITGTAVADALDISGDIDVDGHTNLDNVSIAGVTTSTGNIYADNYFANSGLTLNNNGNPSVNITSTSTTGSSRINFGDPDSNSVGFIHYVHDGDYLKFQTAYNERLRIDSAGRVVIGHTQASTNYGKLLHIHNSASAGASLHLTDSTTGTSNSD